MKNLTLDPSIDVVEKSGRKVAENSGGKRKRTGLLKWRDKVESSTNAYSGGLASGYVIRMFTGKLKGAAKTKERRYVHLGTSDLVEASKKAQAFYYDVKSLGWDKAFTKLHPSSPQQGKDGLTFGDYLIAVKSKWKGEMLTYYDYAAKLRNLVAQILKIEGKPTDKWCGPFGKATPWQTRIEAVFLHEVAPVNVTRFMEKYVENKRIESAANSTEAEGGEPFAALAAKHTVNSLVRNARALFSRTKVVPFLDIAVPDVLPFDGVKLLYEKDGEFRFMREVDPQWLVGEAIRELSKDRPHLFAIFLLALGAGLRRNEIDKLRWRELLQVENSVEVATTPMFTPKSPASLRKVKMPTTFYTVLRSMRGDVEMNDFVIPSAREAKLNTTYRTYRCHEQFTALIAWLKLKGINQDEKSLHSLRKYFGDSICNTFGIYKAAAALGHSKVSTTEIFYAAPPEVEAAPFRLN